MRSVGSRCFAPSAGQTKNTQTHSVVTDLFNIILKIRDRKRRITNKHLDLVTPFKGAVLFSYFLFHSQKETCIKKNREQDGYVVVAKEEVNVRGGVVIN